MQHLDDQLKAAFKLINEDEAVAAKSKPDKKASEEENKKPIKKRSECKMRYFASDA
jgi:hypothetical protein